MIRQGHFQPTGIGNDVVVGDYAPFRIPDKARSSTTGDLLDIKIIKVAPHLFAVDLD